ncbi:Leucine-rich repeat receptor-like protein kinase pxc1 [Ranunculus cassubicifolius]
MLSSILVIFFAISPLLSLSSAELKLSTNDTDSLTRFRLQTDLHGNLFSNWTTSTHPCTASWRGVKCNNGRVTALILPSLNLRGSVDSLSELDQLRVLDLHSNRLNGSILPITHCSNLKLLYLSGNDFSGQIPVEISELNRLVRLDLSDNNLEGPILKEISKLSRLITIRLQNNVLTGQIPNFSASLLGLKEFNVSNNELYGKLPLELQRKFGDGSFLGNSGLCGSPPLPLCTNSPSAAAAQTVPSNPSSLPSATSNSTTTQGEEEKGKKGMHTGAIVGIVIGNVVLLLVITSFCVAYYCGRQVEENDLVVKGNMIEKGRRSGGSYSSEKKVYASGGGDSDDTTASDRSKLVFFDKRKQFVLEDLLRASAELLGKGNLGTVYKAVLEDGCIVAVKRLKDANPCAKKEFEQYMDVIGRLRHLNVVRLRAYYYAKEEKLLVYDYLPNGSLHSLLHGNRGAGRIPLDWTTRISMVLGAARGLARIHEEYSVSKIPHGNVKSSNVLLDKNGIACIADFGLALLLNPIHATARLGGYLAPEQSETKKLSQKADVYSFGVLVLEMLTGKTPALDEQGVDLPKWVRSVVRDVWTAEVFDAELLRYKNIEEELVAMLQVGLTCASRETEKRPTMTEVVKMIEEIRVEQSPLGEDLDGSRSSLSPSLATTDDAF